MPLSRWWQHMRGEFLKIVSSHEAISAQKTEISSGVRVIEEKTPAVAQEGTAASRPSLDTAKVPSPSSSVKGGTVT
jgi:hypothetical protein